MVALSPSAKANMHTSGYISLFFLVLTFLAHFNLADVESSPCFVQIAFSVLFGLFVAKGFMMQKEAKKDK